MVCIVHHHRRELLTLPQQRPGATPERALASHDHLHMDFVRAPAFSEGSFPPPKLF